MACFGGAGITVDVLGIAGYAVAGLILASMVLTVLRRQIVRMPFGADREMAKAAEHG
ncbi:MAG: hypothetical protein ACLQDY_22585 [Streptosporangiaceae bacterium]